MPSEAVRAALADAADARRIPACYLDTNILLDVLRQRAEESAQFIREAPRAGWVLRSSDFALIEVAKREQQARYLLPRVRRGESVDDLLRSAREPDLPVQTLAAVRQNLNKSMSTVLARIEWLQLDDLGWQQALDNALDTNVSAADAIHLAVATSSDCDFIVTRDARLRSSAASVLPGCSAAEALELLHAR